MKIKLANSDLLNSHQKSIMIVLKLPIKPGSKPQHIILILFMNVQKNQQTAPDTKCKACKTFYGSEAYSGLCSSCFKKTLKKEQPKVEEVKLEKASSPASTIGEITEKIQKLELEPSKQEPKVDRKRCYQCRKKVGLLGNECKCGFVYCNMHRLPEEHECVIDHRKLGKLKLEKEIIKVYNGKIEGI